MTHTTLHFKIVALVALLAATGCGERSHQLLLSYPDQAAYDRAQGVEVYIGPSLNCLELEVSGLPPRMQFHAHGEAPDLGEIDIGFVSFRADVRDSDCNLFLDGCVETRVQAGESTVVRIVLQPTSELGCGDGTRCEGGLCLTGDAGATDAAGADVAVADADADDGATPDSATRDGAPTDSAAGTDLTAIGDGAASADAATPDLVGADVVTPDASACTPNTFTCAGDWLVVCDSQGQASLVDCAPHGCNAGASPQRCNLCSPESSSCDDLDPCTHTDTCSGGLCDGTPYLCADDDLCTELSCDGEGGCDVAYNFDPCEDHDVCTSDDVCDGAGSCAGSPWVICGPQPLARYWINEASSGQGEAELLDDTADPVHLGIDYINAATPRFSTGIDGDHHLRFEGTSGEDTGGARADIAGTKLDALHGAAQATIESKHSSEYCSRDDYRVIGLGDGNDGTLNGYFTIREVENGEGLYVRFASGTRTTRIALATGCATEKATVVHWVVDTTEAVQADRVRAYVNGARVATVLEIGELPQLNDTIDLGSGTRKIYLGGPYDTLRTARTRVYYAALYDQPLSDAWIFHNAAKLLADDDGPSHRGVVVKTIGASGRDFSTMQAWEDARGASLATRHVLEVVGGSGTFTPGEVVSGAGCSGSYVAEDEARSNRSLMTVDDVSGACPAGTTLSGASASAELVRVLIEGGTSERGELYADQVIDGLLRIEGAGADPDHFMWLSAGAGQHHHGLAGGGVVIQPSASGHVIHVLDDFTRVEHLEVTGWPNYDGFNSYEGITLDADRVLVNGMLIHDDAWGPGVEPRTSNPNSDGISLNSLVEGETVFIRNSIVYNIGRACILRQDEGATGTITAHIDNCTLFNCMTSGNQADGTGNLTNQEPTFVVHARNVLSMDACGSATCTTGPADDFENLGTWGTFTHCMSSDGSASGTSSHTGMSSADQFVSTVAGLEDLHLLPTADAVDQGVTRPSTVDIDGEGRPVGGSWDIGADEQR